MYPINFGPPCILIFNFNKCKRIIFESFKTLYYAYEQFQKNSKHRFSLDILHFFLVKQKIFTKINTIDL